VSPHDEWEANRNYFGEAYSSPLPDGNWHTPTEFLNLTSLGYKPGLEVGIDCSGLVSRAWGDGAWAWKEGTYNLEFSTYLQGTDITSLASLEDLNKGDIVVDADWKPGASLPGHVLVFYGWDNISHNNVIAYDAATGVTASGERPCKRVAVRWYSVASDIPADALARTIWGPGAVRFASTKELHGTSISLRDGKVRYSIPTTSIVRLQVYDMSGKIIATLVNGKQGAGRYAVEWPHAPNMRKSGTYLLRLSTEGSSQCTHVVLIF